MKIITISREYAAGGHSIGRKVAEQLGIEFYDRDIIAATAQASGIDSTLIAKEEETISRTDNLLRYITPISYDQKDVIYNYERQVILKLAQGKPFVILGRTANIILQEAGIPSLDVFIYADNQHRIARAGELLHSSNQAEILHTIKKVDHARHSYYSYYTGQHWGDLTHYTMALDSGALGYDTCIQLICEAAKRR